MRKVLTEFGHVSGARYCVGTAASLHRVPGAGRSRRGLVFCRVLDQTFAPAPAATSTGVIARLVEVLFTTLLALVVYLVGPLVGGALAAGVHRGVQHGFA